MAFTLRLSHDQEQALTLLASAQGLSKHEAAVRAILTAAARLLDDAEITELARAELDGFAAHEARIRRARTSGGDA
ncbi:hypothetical protein [Corynebacterium uterequi]|uniref:CopG family transcriptional regulator n=1 Tax=Corynebacterium uterequi TaxID=1072256 RepID=A0A0G3H9L0_9CORY|nr:hypothetical protein [Corynebacterium uterequi]AKK10056.1 hypothetical protein CUTER_00120 [Corynebacterium uterequi]